MRIAEFLGWALLKARKAGFTLLAPRFILEPLLMARKARLEKEIKEIKGE